jgi:antitoxin component HigA of HigAB toxin-antitoxin module
MSALTAYQALLVEFQPRPLRSASAYKKALGQVEQLLKKPRLSNAERDLVETLSTLIEQYEAIDYPTPDVPPTRLLAHLLEAGGVTQAEVCRATGIARSNLSAVLAGRRAISKGNALKLASYFGLPAHVFLEEGA